MIVGFLRISDRPSRLAQLLSYTCNYYGINLVYFTPEGIRIGNDKIRGKMLIDHKWESVEVSIPNFIDISPHLFTKANYKKKIHYLQKNTTLSINRRHIITKENLQVLLSNHEELKDYYIPSVDQFTFNQLIDFLEQYKKVVVKPTMGLKGRSVIVIEQIDSSQYVMGEQKKENTLNKEELHEYFINRISGNKFVAQKYIKSRNLQGEPFDCRIHVEKNGLGEWETVNKFIRVGIGQKVVSNISQGGGISKLNPFLKANFPSSFKDIEIKLKKLARTVPLEIERITKSKLMVMGIDVGIDQEGNLFIFEINSFPIVTPQLSEITLIRPQYYKYMLSMNNQENKLSSLNKSLMNKSKRFEKEIRKIKSSTSWRITKPIRYIGAILKRKGKQ